MNPQEGALHQIKPLRENKKLSLVERLRYYCES